MSDSLFDNDELGLNEFDGFDTIEFHYCFDDENRHAINAKTLIDCEKAFYDFSSILSKSLGIDEILIEPREKGSLDDVWRFLQSVPNSTLIPFYAVAGWKVLTYFLNYRLESKKQKLNETKMTEESLEKIDHLNKENNPEYANLIIENLLKTKQINKNQYSQLIKKQSDFFLSVSKNDNISAVGAFVKNPTTQERRLVKKIHRREFNDYILPEVLEVHDSIDENETSNREIDENARIELIGVALIEQNKNQWKGKYNDRIIEFYVKDEKWAGDISRQYKNGEKYTLVCKLEYSKKQKKSSFEYKNCQVIEVVDFQEKPSLFDGGE